MTSTLASTTARPRALGRGLSALLGESTQHTASIPQVLEKPKTMPVHVLQAGRYQPRQNFNEAALEEMADSIRKHGILQPLVVRPITDGTEGVTHEIIAGERRWRAAQRVGLDVVPVIIKEMDDRTALELALVENVQRADLDPIEEAEGYLRLMEDFDYTHDMIAETVGKSRPYVSNILRLLSLPMPVRAMVATRELSLGHAKVLMAARSPRLMAERVVREGMSVRVLEMMIAKEKAETLETMGVEPIERKKRTTSLRDANAVALERELTGTLGLDVRIMQRTQDRGSVTVSYQSLDQLDSLLSLLRKGVTRHSDFDE